jgi:hypothetical protein
MVSVGAGSEQAAKEREKARSTIIALLLTSALLAVPIPFGALGLTLVHFLLGNVDDLANEPLELLEWC